MIDKKYDDFFDEEKGGTTQDKELLSILTHYDKPRTKELKAGAKITGTITRVTAEYVFVSLDGKSEGALRAGEVKDKEGTIKVKVGDSIDAYVSSTTGGNVDLTLSMNAVNAGTDELLNVMNNKVPVQGKVTGINKGGLQVKIMGQRAFCPVSFIDIKFVDDVNVYLNKTFTFVIQRITEGGKNIVVSRIPILELELWKKLDEFEAAIAERKTYAGTVTRIADFGLFVDMGGGMEGLVHISEVSWERAENLAQSFTAGQQVEFVALKIERGDTIRNTKISLSMKQALPDPWITAAATFLPGTQVPGKITRLAKFGAFVELTAGVEGLIPMSELSWSRRIRTPDEVVKPGQLVSVNILSVDAVARRISCSLKSVEQDPWTTVPERFPVGATVPGTVESQSSYGFFVELAEGVSGLLVNQNIAPERKGEVKPKAQIAVSIDSLDTELRRIGLSFGMASIKADEAAVRDYMDKMQAKAAVKAQEAAASTSEFGDMLKAALVKKG